MAFLAAVARFISQEVLSRVGKNLLAEAQRVFDAELAKGTDQKTAARMAAEHLMKHTAISGKDKVVKMGKTAGRMAHKGAVFGVKKIREELKKK